MSKTVTLRIEDGKYKLFKLLALQDNRTLSNFLETAIIRHIEEQQLIDDFEMDEINNNSKLQASMKRGLKDLKKDRGSFV